MVFWSTYFSTRQPDFYFQHKPIFLSPLISGKQVQALVRQLGELTRLEQALFYQSLDSCEETLCIYPDLIVAARLNLPEGFGDKTLQPFFF